MALSRQDLEFASPDAFARLGEELDRLSTEGRLYDEAEVGPRHERRIRITRTYLFLLGYLRSDSGRTVVDGGLGDALARFQRDLGRTPTHIPDDPTWRALQELVPYDAETSIERWLREELGSALLERAIHLRLFSYGLVSRPPSSKRLGDKAARKQRQTTDGALEDFARVASMLGLADAPLDPTRNRETLALLFDHQRLVDRLARNRRGFMVFASHPALPLGERKEKQLRNDFVRNVAIVELWLLGYPLRPGNLRPEGPNGRDADGSLKSELDEFCKDRKVDVPHRGKIMLGGWFFEEAAKLRARPDVEPTVEDAELDVVLAKPKKLKALARTYRSLGARIIDGVRRAVDMVIGWFQRAIRAFKKIVKNLARALHGAALAMYKRLEPVVRTVSIGFEYLFSSEVKGSDPRVVAIYREVDFDFDVFVNHRAPESRVDAFFDLLELRARAMLLGGQIIGQFLELVRSVALMASGALTWLGIIIALVKLGNWLRRSRELWEEASLLIERFEASEHALTA